MPWLLWVSVIWRPADFRRRPAISLKRVRNFRRTRGNICCICRAFGRRALTTDCWLSFSHWNKFPGFFGSPKSSESRFWPRAETIERPAKRSSKRAAQNLNTPQLGEAIKHLELARLCAVHDVSGYLRTLSPEERKSLFWPLLLDGKLLAADDVVKKDADGRDVTQRGLLYLVAVKQHDKALVESEWQQLIACLDRGGRDLRYLGKVLKGSEPIDAAALRELPIDPDQKRVLLTVVAQRFPDADKTIAALARRLDYQRDEVSLCLRSLK